MCVIAFRLKQVAVCQFTTKTPKTFKHIRLWRSGQRLKFSHNNSLQKVTKKETLEVHSIKLGNNLCCTFINTERMHAILCNSNNNNNKLLQFCKFYILVKGNSVLIKSADLRDKWFSQLTFCLTNYNSSMTSL